jgi:hypothetical protein
MSDIHPIGLTVAESARKKGDLTEAMAACIRGRIEGLGSCDRYDLLRDGFAEIEIAHWYDRAEQLALGNIQCSAAA